MVNANTYIPRFPILHWPVHPAYNPPHDPHRVHNVVGPVICVIGTLLAAGVSLYFLNSTISGETAAWASIASFIFVPIVVAGVFILAFLFSWALGRFHTIGSLIGLGLGIGLILF